MDNLSNYESEDYLQQAPARQACLLALDGDLEGQVLKLQEHTTIIGRDENSDITLTSSDVSRSHAMITNRHQKFLVSDLESTNGTVVNRKQITHPMVLVDGDTLIVGNLKFRFMFTEADKPHLEDDLKFSELKDQLTGVYSKKYFLDLAKNEFEYCRRKNDKLGLILFDIDDLRVLIDRLGYDAGDKLVREMAKLVDNSARAYDLFARYSNDEFVFLIRGTEPEQLVYIADRIRKLVADTDFSFKDESINITLSVGVASYDGGFKYDGVGQFLAAADQHLGKARELGRNSIYA